MAESRVSQEPVEVVVKSTVLKARVSQLAIEVLVPYVPFGGQIYRRRRRTTV